MQLVSTYSFFEMASLNSFCFKTYNYFLIIFFNFQAATLGSRGYQ